MNFWVRFFIHVTFSSVYTNLYSNHVIKEQSDYIFHEHAQFISMQASALRPSALLILVSWDDLEVIGRDFPELSQFQICQTWSRNT